METESNNNPQSAVESTGLVGIRTMSEEDIEKLKAELALYKERQKQCATMDEAEKLALIRALQEIRDAVGMIGGDGVSPKQIVEAVRACMPTDQGEARR